MTDAHDSSPRASGHPTFIRPLVDFVHTEAAGGVALVIATLVALVWANSPWDASYEDLWNTDLTLTLGSHQLDLDLRGWINEGLMAVFFFVVGLEIKRELVEGELRDRRKAALPAVAAVGGMVVPAAIYLAFAGRGDGAGGWGIPMATDIALAIGVLSLLGRRVAPSLKLFILALAMVDDVGAILVIAVYYADEVQLDALAVAVGMVGIVAVMRGVGVHPVLPFVVAGVVLWAALDVSGVHATLAGVVLGLMTPTRPARQPELIDAAELADVSTYDAALQTATLARQAVSVVEWLEHRLHPWTSFVIVPLFALANAGVALDGDVIGEALTSAVAGGVVVGLVVGKLAGITAFTWIAVRLGIGTLPQGARWPGIVGVSALAGIGFTVSIFVAGLAFDDPALRNQAKVAILAASVIAAVLGSALLTVMAGRQPAADEPAPALPAAARPK